MFNLFEEENEPMTEAAKLRFLLDKVNHPQLESDVSALRVKNNLASGEDKVTFTKAENILAASVSILPNYQSKSRVVSGVGKTITAESIVAARYSKAIIRTGMNYPRKTKKRLTPSVPSRAQRNNPKTKRLVVKFHSSIPKPL